MEIASQAKKDLKKVPKHIVIKLMAWIEDIGARGLQKVRKIPGYNDEVLKGNRRGQRSIRLSKAYRAIYVTDKSKMLACVKIMEVNKHEY